MVLISSHSAFFYIAHILMQKIRYTIIFTTENKILF